jgi:hypothetical protein
MCRLTTTTNNNEKAVENETVLLPFGAGRKAAVDVRDSNVRAVAARKASSSPNSKQLVRRRCSQILVRKKNE